ncbi:hypothetical protein [Nocardia terpenica]|uniref:Cytochrome P450 n=1 Tax=Nocardia terpenica TaxID=455432 RepID=A0A164MRH7_9NOCA|nr:hypothetical protein [Nocardia terpenica]KZM73595.1 hypothetical protein AWN90_33910 [Nocardia terpenica]
MHDSPPPVTGPTRAVLSDPIAVRAALDTAPVPPVPAAAVGMAWLRSRVARFSHGPEHTRRRELIEAELRRVSPADLRERVRAVAHQPLAHVRILAESLGLQNISPEVVATAATGYLPPAPLTPETDRAVGELVAACGGSADDVTAARIAVLLQSCAATTALLERARNTDATGSAGEVLDRVLATDPPPVRTRRVIDGAITELDLAAVGLPFGAGPHACPGREHALALAAGILEGSR